MSDDYDLPKQRHEPGAFPCYIHFFLQVSDEELKSNFLQFTGYNQTPELRAAPNFQFTRKLRFKTIILRSEKINHHQIDIIKSYYLAELQLKCKMSI